MAKKNALISVSNENGTLTFNVGEAGSFTVDTASLPAEITARAMLHGLVQKISDAAAIAKSELTGNAKKDAATKLAAMTAVRDRLVAGDWSKRNGDGSGPVAGLIFRAFEQWVTDRATAAKKPVPDSDKLREVYDAKTRAEQLALRNVPEIAVIIDRMKSERGATVNVDTDGLLGELGL